MQSQISFLNRIKLVKEKFYKTYDDDEIKSHLFFPFLWARTFSVAQFSGSVYD